MIYVSLCKVLKKISFMCTNIGDPNQTVEIRYRDWSGLNLLAAYMGLIKGKDVFEYVQNAQIRIHLPHTQSPIWTFALHWYIIIMVSNDSVSGQ